MKTKTKRKGSAPMKLKKPAEKIGFIALKRRGDGGQAIVPMPPKAPTHLDYRIVLNNAMEAVAPGMRQTRWGDGSVNDWWIRHRDTFEELGMTPGKKEHPVASLIRALGLYETRHFEDHGRLIAHDGYLGPVWLSMYAGVRDLLNGELGAMDGGLLSSMLTKLARNAGFSEEEIA